MSSPNSIDVNLARSLVPTLNQLIALSTTPSTQPPARSNETEFSQHASKIRIDLNTLKLQATAMTGGELSMDDQDWLISELERELEQKR